MSVCQYIRAKFRNVTLKIELNNRGPSGRIHLHDNNYISHIALYYTAEHYTLHDLNLEIFFKFTFLIGPYCSNSRRSFDSDVS